MKTLKYFLSGLILIIFITAGHSQTMVNSKKVITLQSVAVNAPGNLLAASKEILARRLHLTGLRDVQISENDAAPGLVVTVGDTVSDAVLSELLLTRGNAGLRADTTLALDRENIREVHADFADPEHPALCITFREEKWKTWEDLTNRNMGKTVGLIIDGKTYAFPQITEKISGGKISLTGGGFSRAGVRKLVAIISCGPVPLEFSMTDKH